MRTKEVSIKLDDEEKKYKIASLTVDEVDILFPGGQAEVKGKENTIKVHMVPVVAASLNNITVGSGKWFPLEGPWPEEYTPTPNGGNPLPPVRLQSPKDVSGDLDFAEVLGLYREITRFTGLKTEVSKAGVQTEVAPAGEAKAAGPIM